MCLQLEILYTEAHTLYIFMYFPLSERDLSTFEKYTNGITYSFAVFSFFLSTPTMTVWHLLQMRRLSQYRALSLN